MQKDRETILGEKGEERERECGGVMAEIILRLTEQAKLPQRLRIKVMWWKLSWTCDLGLAGKQKLRADVPI